jgi:hypothetical protein
MVSAQQVTRIYFENLARGLAWISQAMPVLQVRAATFRR